MTNCIQSMLEDAAAGVQPEVADPLAEIMRRAQIARHRQQARAAVAGVALVILVTGGVVAGVRSARGGPPSGAPTTTQSSMPPRRLVTPPPLAAEVVDGEVRVHGLVVPVPAGWHVLRNQTRDYCDVAPRSVLIDVRTLPAGGNCNDHPQIALSGYLASGVVPIEAIHPSMPGRGLNEVILPGGQPLWLDDNDINNFDAARRFDWATVGGQDPWSGVVLGVDVESAGLGKILRSIRSDTVAPQRLVLPERSSQAYLGVSGSPATNIGDQDVIDLVLQRLGALDKPVQAGDLPCASGRALSPEWTLAGVGMARLILVGADGRSQATIAIGRSSTCAFATSSLGGRVWLPSGFFDQLRDLIHG